MELSDTAVEKLMEWRRARDEWFDSVQAKPFDLKAADLAEDKYKKAENDLAMKIHVEYGHFGDKDK